MALEFERNINLEEIDSDALFGISYLSNQTFTQKIIFFGCAIISVGAFLVTQMYLELPSIVSLLISGLIGGVGFLFGANQCEYLTIAQYLKLIFFKPVKYANFSSTEDIGLMKDALKRVSEEEAIKQKQMDEATPEGQRRMLIMVIGFASAFVIFALIIMAISAMKEDTVVHHTALIINNLKMGV